MLSHIIVTEDSPNSFYFYGKITKKFAPQRRMKSNGEEFLSYGCYLSVYGAPQFLEEYTNEYKAPENIKSMVFPFYPSKNVYDQLEEGDAIVIKGGLSAYTTERGERKYKIQLMDILFNNSRYEPSHVNVNTQPEIAVVAEYNKAKPTVAANYTDDTYIDFTPVEESFNAFIEDKIDTVVTNEASVAKLPNEETKRIDPVLVSKNHVRAKDNSEYKNIRINA